MQTESVYPDLSDRSSPKEWEDLGKPVLVNEVAARFAAILGECDNGLLNADMDARLRARFDLLVV